jgi:hypothetical protein
MRNNSIPQQHDRFALARDRQLRDLIEGLDAAWDDLADLEKAASSMAHAGMLVGAQFAIAQTLTFLINLREGRLP